MESKTRRTILLISIAAVVLLLKFIPCVTSEASPAGKGGFRAPGVTCNSCSDCSAKLASGLYSTVTLTVDIVNHGGSCINANLGESDLVFDCDGHLIDGDDLAIDPDYGIYFLHGANNTVRNCLVEDFAGGVYIGDAVNHTVENTRTVSNGIGLLLAYSSGTTIDRNIILENVTGAKLDHASTNAFTDNRVCYNSYQDFNLVASTGNSGSRNQCLIPDGWNDDGATGCEFPCWTCWLHLPLIAR